MKTTMAGHAGRGAFTLVEIMIAVAIIALLATIAVPAFRKARANTQNTQFINDLRVARDGVEQVAMVGPYPADTNPGEEPDSVGEYIPRFDWDQPTPIGGQWDWDNGTFGVRAGVSVYLPNRTAVEMREIDKQIDDGDLATGVFQQRTDGYIYIIEQ